MTRIKTRVDKPFPIVGWSLEWARNGQTAGFHQYPSTRHTLCVHKMSSHNVLSQSWSPDNLPLSLCQRWYLGYHKSTQLDWWFFVVTSPKSCSTKISIHLHASPLCLISSDQQLPHISKSHMTQSPLLCMIKGLHFIYLHTFDIMVKLTIIFPSIIFISFNHSSW